MPLLVVLVGLVTDWLHRFLVHPHCASCVESLIRILLLFQTFCRV
jgi:hypothetical protein